MIYHVKSEQVSLNKRLARTAFVFAVNLLGAFVIPDFWFAQTTARKSIRVRESFDSPKEQVDALAHARI